MTFERNASGDLLNVQEIEIDLKNKPDYYIKYINSQGKKVPALQTESGEILIESAVITEYILEKFGKDRVFFGKNLEQKAYLRMFTQLFSDLFIGNFYGLMRSTKVQRVEATEVGRSSS